MAQALVQFLKYQCVERDGSELPFFGGMWGIFGHGNVAGIGQALQQMWKKAGIETANQKALGVAPWDYDGDGRVDILVSNDTAPNNLFHNRGDGTFEDVAIPTGVAVDEGGRARGAMGAAWADTKNARGFALAIGNFSNELKSLYWTDTGEETLQRPLLDEGGDERQPVVRLLRQAAQGRADVVGD